MDENRNEINEEINEIEETMEALEEQPEEAGISVEEISYVEVTEESEPSQAEEPKKKRSILKEIGDWVFSIAVALLAVLLINQFLLIQVQVDGSSMVPTLQDEDRLFAYRLGYEPKNGDIVVLDPDRSGESVKGKLMFDRILYIKRVIATEGQTIDVKNGKVYVDDKALNEEYVAPGAITKSGTTSLPLKVPEDCVFVMGDNREHSKDSRDQSVGIVAENRIVGKAFFRLFPFRDFGPVK